MHKLDPGTDIRFEIKRSSFDTRSAIEKSLANQLTRQAQATISKSIQNLTLRIYHQSMLLALAHGQHISNDLVLNESGINDILNNYLLISKSEVRGISGYFCESCLAFHSRYIVNIGVDLIAGERHTCIPTILAWAESLPDKNRQRDILYHKSIYSLLHLTRSLLHSRSFVTIRRFSPDKVQANNSDGAYRL